MPGPHQNSLHITQFNYAFHFLQELWLIHMAYNALNDLTFDSHSSFTLLNSSLLTCLQPLRVSLWSLNTPSLSLSLDLCLCFNCPASHYHHEAWSLPIFPDWFKHCPLRPTLTTNPVNLQNIMHKALSKMSLFTCLPFSFSLLLLSQTARALPILFIPLNPDPRIILIMMYKLDDAKSFAVELISNIKYVQSNI